MSRSAQHAVRTLIVMTSHDRFGDTGRPSGAWYAEIAAPYFVFRDAGCDVTFASIRGGAAVIDPLSRQPEWQTPATRRADADAHFQAALASMPSIDEIEAFNFDIALAVGGFGAMWDMPDSASLRAVVEHMLASPTKVMATLCHGAAALVSATDKRGKPAVAGRLVTSFTNSEECVVGGDSVVPFLLESRVRELGGDFRAGNDWSDTVQVSGRLVTGQNPASAESTARAALQNFLALTA